MATYMHRTIDMIPPAGGGSAAPRHAAVPHSIRSRGRLDLRFARRGEKSVVADSYQSGCVRMRLPRVEHAGEAPCAVLINTAGGLAEGDAIEQRIRWDADTSATVTSQAAEKVYRALKDGATISNSIAVGSGAHAEWLPQETILFDNARLRRDTRITLDDDVTYVGIEAVIFGRKAMGETVRRGFLDDRLRIWRGGRLIYADAFVLDGPVEDLMARPAIGDGAGAMAVIVHAAADAASLLDPLREALSGAHGRAAASCWNGLLVTRFLAPDGEALRHDIVPALAVLRGGRPLPRVWRC